MKGSRVFRRSILRQAAHIVVPLAAVLGAGAFGGCLTRPIKPIDPRTTSTVVASINEKTIDKIDILLAIDNSQSMYDKQQVLSKAIPTLVGRLVNPWCVNSLGDGGTDGTPTKPPAAGCASVGKQPEFTAINDIHIGIVSSSLGGHGVSTTCQADPAKCDINNNPTNNDQGHLITRTAASPGACNLAPLPTYKNLGFLAWDYGNHYGGETNEANLEASLAAMVIGVGQIGCGYESQLESWYRFLIEPEPWTTITLNTDAKGNPTTTSLSGTDTALLQQRAAFLRPDSLVAIIGVTDENDTSFRDGPGQYWIVDEVSSTFHMPAARGACQTSPDDPCCGSCASADGAFPSNCKPSAQDSACAAAAAYTAITDDPNERGWNNKVRYGINFLYPISRYVAGLTQAQVVGTQTGKTQPNPLYSRLQGQDPKVTLRSPSDKSVFLAYIVGVPWQDISVDPTTQLTWGIKNSDQLLATDTTTGLTGWDVILGTTIDQEATPPLPASGLTINVNGASVPYVPPADKHMIESTTPRAGLSAPVNPAPASGSQPDPINGSEWTITKNSTGAQGDLEYACRFKLPASRDCTDTETNPACDCTQADNDNPLCDVNPNPKNPGTGGATQRTLQTYAKAYPGIRELALVKALGTQGIAASICPEQLDPTKADLLNYGYTPAVNGIIDRLKSKLHGQCLPTALSPDEKGSVPCRILEATSASAGCNCDAAKARQAPLEAAEVTALQSNTDYMAACLTAVDGGFALPDNCCVCEIVPLTGTKADCATNANDEPLHTCQCLNGDDGALQLPNNSDGTASTGGWCYVDPNHGIGSAALIASCPPNQPQKIRFVNKGQPTGATFITCLSE